MPAARRERKVVTVLFADLVGSTSRAEQMDPEDVAAELEGYPEDVAAELEGYQGRCALSWSGSAGPWRSSSATQ